jgi:carbon storage regulator
MLVLSRKAGQRIQIGSEIEVAVLSTRKGRVKLGFTAPPSVAICRQELDQLELPATPLAAAEQVTEHAGEEERLPCYADP